MDSTTVCRLLLLAALALSTNRVLSTSMTAIHQPIQSGIAESIAAVFTVVGLLLLIPLTGVVGAGLTSLVAYAVSSSYMLFRLGKLFETPPFRLVIPQFRLSNAFAGMRARASVEEAK